MNLVGPRLCLIAIGLAPVAAKAVEPGPALFEPCRACHALDPAARGMAGPNLTGIIGRRIAGDPQFDYSPVLRQAATSGARWSREKLDRFLTDPEATFPGMWMTSRPMPDGGERKALLDFLADPKSR